MSSWHHLGERVIARCPPRGAASLADALAGGVTGDNDDDEYDDDKRNKKDPNNESKKPECARCARVTQFCCKPLS